MLAGCFIEVLHWEPFQSKCSTPLSVNIHMHALYSHTTPSIQNLPTTVYCTELSLNGSENVNIPKVSLTYWRLVTIVVTSLIKPFNYIKASSNGCNNEHSSRHLLLASEPLKTFTFMHLADAFIQSDLHCIQVTVSTFYQLLLSLGIEPMILALLAPCSTSWATGKTQWITFVCEGNSQNHSWSRLTYRRSEHKVILFIFANHLS